jgi:hypothetical protein
MGGPSTSSDIKGSSSLQWKAAAFTMPAGDDYLLDSVTLYLLDVDATDQPLISLYSTNFAVQLTTFTNPASYISGANVFVSSSSFTLEAGTKYWITVQDIAPEQTPEAKFRWGANNGINFSSDIGASSSGYVVGNGNPVAPPITSSSFRNLFQINGHLVPEPTSVALIAAGSLMLLLRSSGKSRE